MSIHRILATAIRVLRQLQHDPRTVGLILVVPCALLAIMKYIFQDNRPLFDSVAPLLLGLYPLVMMFLVTSVTTLRERTSGTLDRLMTMPLSKFDLMFGYALAFTVVAIVQAVLAGIVTLTVLQVPVQGSGVAIVGIATASAFLGTTLGLLVSAFASSEFQAVQFMPALLFPQILTCGLFVPRDQMATLLQWFADIMPLTYSLDAMKQILLYPSWTLQCTRDLLVVLGYGIALLLFGSVTIRRTE